MRPVIIYPPAGAISGKVVLPASKSISNRLLIIRALSKSGSIIDGISESGDTVLLKKLLKNLGDEVNAEDAGTAYRFLTAFLSCQSGLRTLTGTERMLKRPIGPLVEALNQAGADIRYKAINGYPPLLIRGKKLDGGEIELDATLSSQFVSALLMVGPFMERGLTLVLEHEPASAPYIHMTIEIMRRCGADVNWVGDRIEVKSGAYSVPEIKVEADWSSAAFYYEICALTSDCSLELSDLTEHSIQGDCSIDTIMQAFQVRSSFGSNGIHLEKLKQKEFPEYFKLDCSDIPDLAPALICTCAGLGIAGEFSGVHTLRIKESNRIVALQTELAKLGLQSEYNSDDDVLYLDRTQLRPYTGILNTHADHRIAMALAPLCLKIGPVKIDDADVVKKSFPSFWKQLSELGFVLNDV